MILCEVDITSTPFCDTKILTYKIEEHPSGKKVRFYLLDYEYFTISYVIDTIPNSPAGHELTQQAKKNVWSIAIKVEYPITDQCLLYELHIHQTQRGKSKVKISLCKSKRYQKADLE